MALYGIGKRDRAFGQYGSQHFQCWLRTGQTQRLPNQDRTKFMNDEGVRNETHISTEQHPPQTHPRFSGPHEDQERPRRSSPQTSQRAQTSSRLAFRSRDRIKTRPEFLACYSQGKKYHSRYFLLFCREADVTHGPVQTRLGLAMSRKSGNAVQRNRWKRLVREFFRQGQEAFPRGCDIVVVAKRGADPLRLGLTDVANDLHSVLRRVRRDYDEHANGSTQSRP